MPKTLNIVATLLLACIFCICFLLQNPKVHAATDTYSYNAGWNQSACESEINNSYNNAINVNVNVGDTIKASFTNTTAIDLVITAGGTGANSLSPSDYVDDPSGQAVTVTIGITGISAEALEVYNPSASCSNPQYTSVNYLPVASGSLSCSLANNTNWVINSTYYVSSPFTIALYEGSSPANSSDYTNNQASSGNNGSGSLSGTFTAGSTTEFYLYDGGDNSYPLLAQVSCPSPSSSNSSSGSGGSTGSSGSKSKVTASSSSSSSSKPTTTSGNTKSSTATTLSLTPTTAPKTNHLKPKETSYILPISLGVSVVILAIAGFFAFKLGFINKLKNRLKNKTPPPTSPSTTITPTQTPPNVS